MEDNIQNYLPTVMFRGTPCINKCYIITCYIVWSRQKPFFVLLSTHVIKISNLYFKNEIKLSANKRICTRCKNYHVDVLQTYFALPPPPGVYTM